MALPHVIQMQLIRKRLIGKTGKQRLEEIKQIFVELPKYNTGPYGEIRKWLREEIRKTRTKSKVKHRDWLGVKRQGIKQFVLVGSPSVGKSSLIKELSGLQTKIADYSFTTLKPLPAVIKVNWADFQIIDLPGLVEGATQNIGGGKRLIEIVKQADGILLMHDLSRSIGELEMIIKELNLAGIQKNTIIIGNKLDLMYSKYNLEELKKKFPNNIILGISAVTREGLDTLKQELWKTSKLIRVYPKGKKEPLILERNLTIMDFASKIHKDIVPKLKFAIVTGNSAKFPNQQVGKDHILEDKDIVELILKN
ncbi:GTPase [Nanoarchaeota archaeon]